MEVPGRIFEAFLKRLEDDKLTPAAVERLRAVLLSEKSITEKAVAEALLAEEPLV